MKPVQLDHRIEPRYETVGYAFGNRSNFFAVPKYQRSYAWSETQLDDFLTDIARCYNARLNKEEPVKHFFGGIVSVERIIPGSSISIYDLVDGQQRVSTFVLLVACMIRKYQEIESDARESEDEKILSSVSGAAQRLKDVYISTEIRVNMQLKAWPRLDMSRADRDFFRDIISGREPQVTKQSPASHGRIQYAFNAIYEWLSAVLEEQVGIDKAHALFYLEQVLDEDCGVIFINTWAQKLAYRLFQVLNDRGSYLTEGDLLRAKTLELLDGHSADQNSAEAHWDKILSDDPAFTTDFLRWYYSSVFGKAPVRRQLFDDLLDGLFPQHQNTQISPSDSNAIVQQIGTMSQEIVICRKLIEAEWPYDTSSASKWQRERLYLLIKKLDHTHCIPLLLAAFKLPERKFATLVHLIERFFFRYKMMCNQHIGPLSKVYLNHAQQIRADGTGYDIGKFVTDLKKLEGKATNGLFIAGMENELIYHTDKSNRNLKYFLITIEQYWESQRKSKNPPKYDSSRVWDIEKTSIEHVYPRNPAVVIPELEPYVNRLGNLTIMGPEENNNLGNGDFSVKKPELAKSTVGMNQAISQCGGWSPSDIEAREETLKQIALKIFSAW